MSAKVETDFAVGDVVKLRCGGRDMVVDAITAPNGDEQGKLESDSKVRTIWQDEAGALHTSHGLSPALLESVSKVEREKADDREQPDDGVSRSIGRQDISQSGAAAKQSHEDWRKDRSVPGQGNADNNSPSQLNRPQSAFEQSNNPGKVHEGDGETQSLGNEAERQPAQEAEIAHAKMTDDPKNDVGTVHEEGKAYKSDPSLKDNR